MNERPTDSAATSADNHATPAAGALGRRSATSAPADAAEALMAALRHQYAVPSGRAPFLTFDTVARDVADLPASAADASAEDSALAAAELAAADEWAAPAMTDDMASSHEKAAKMTPYDPNVSQTNAGLRSEAIETTLPPPPADPIYRAMSPAPYRPAGSDMMATLANRPPTQRQTFARGLMAAAAAILIVGLLGGVFYAFGFSHRSNGPVVHHTPPVIHYFGAKAQWQSLGQFSTDFGVGYVVAQSNPRIIYEIASEQSGSDLVKRSADGGATWQAVALPTGDFPDGVNNGVGLTVSPVNPQVLIVLLIGDEQNPNCPAYVNANSPGTDSATRHAIAGRANATSASAKLSPTTPASGGYSCTFQYVSSDGGATWSKLQLPGAVKLTTPSLQISVDASGAITSSRLYSSASPDINGFAPYGSRLMTSADGGVSWTFADAPLLALGWIPYTFTPTDTGETIFADTVPVGLNSGNAQAEDAAPHEFWRSDDAGAHWTKLGKTPSLDRYGDLGQLSATQANGKTLLYSALVNSVTKDVNGIPMGGGTTTPDSVYVSLDSGKSWTHAPAAGVAPGLTTASAAIGTLSDGSAVFQFTKQTIIETPLLGGGTGGEIIDEGSTYYSWRPGATAWTQLTPHLDEQGVNPQWLAPAGAGQPETIWALAMTGNDVTLEKCALS